MRADSPRSVSTGIFLFTFDLTVMAHEPFISTGLTGLDHALGDALRPGNVIGVISGTGGGKTVLATQIIRHAMDRLPSNQILLISTEAPGTEFWRRNLSATFTIPYSASIEEEGYLMKDQQGFLWPNYKKLGPEAVIRAKELLQRFRLLNFQPIPNSGGDTSQEIAEYLAEFQGALAGLPGLVVVDYLNRQSFAQNEWAAREFMQKSMEVIRNASISGPLLIIVFAQATQKSIGKRRLGPQDIADCKNLFATADAFAAISQEYGSDPRDDDEVGPPSMYRRSQTIIVSLAAEGGVAKRVPVTRRFEFQRFEDREEAYDDPNGYLPFSRNRFRELCALPLKNCINVYLYLAFLSRFRESDKNIGISWPSHEGIAKATGLSDKQVRTAIARLEDKGLVKVKKSATTNRYKIRDWTFHHDASGAAEVKNTYVRLSRGLMDEPGQEIFSEPSLLRLWVYIIMNTQMFQDKKHWELHRGCIHIDFTDIEHETGTKKKDCLALLSRLETRGSIEKLDGVNLKLLYRVTNWDCYQPDV
jgi:DNA-binding transcriptional ArsR family regulator